MRSSSDKTLPLIALFRSYYPSIILAIIGCLVTLFIFIQLRNDETTLARAELEVSAVSISLAIQKELHLATQILNGFKGLFLASEFVTREEFSEFYFASIDDASSLQAVEWIPLVKADEVESLELQAHVDGYTTFQVIEVDESGKIIPVKKRNYYYPVFYIEPMLSNEQAFGFDLGSNPTRLEALNLATHSGEVVATSRIRLVQEDEDQYGFLLFLPIYTDQVEKNLVEPSQSELLGFLLAVFRIGDLVTDAVEDENIEAVEFVLWDVGSDNADQLLFSSSEVILSDNDLEGGVEQKIEFATRFWQLDVYPSQGELLPIIPSHIWRVVVLGLALTTLTAFMLGKFQQNKNQREALINISPFGSHIYELSGNNQLLFRGANASAEKILQLDHQKFVGLTIKEVFPGVEKNGLEEELKNVAAVGIPYSDEAYHYSDGVIEGVFDLKAIQLSRNNVVVFFQDISALLESQKSLRESEEKFRKTLDIADDAIVSIDENHNIIFFNLGAEKNFGYRAEEIIGKPLDILIPNRLVKVHKKHIDDFDATSINSRMMDERSEIIAKRKDGSTFPAESSISKLETNGKKVYTAILRDISERIRFTEKIEKQVIKLSALREIDMAITGTIELNVILKIILEQVCSNLQVDAASVLLMDQETKILENIADRGFHSEGIKKYSLHLGEGYAGRAAQERKSILLTDLNSPNVDFVRKEFLAKEKFVFFYAAPLIATGKVVGVLEIFHRDVIEPDEDWLSFIEMLSGQTAIAIDNALLFSDLQQSNDELQLAYQTTLEGWSKALELRDDETQGHTNRVTNLTMQLADRLGIIGEAKTQMRRGALLHDIGKIAIPDSILLK